MIEHKDFQEAYEILCYVSGNLDKLEAGYKANKLGNGNVPCIQYFDGKVQYICIDALSYDGTVNKIKFRSINTYSFIRGDHHRSENVNIQLAYHPSTTLRLGADIIDGYDYSEANMFQQSLVLSPEEYMDLEFICFLREKKFSNVIIFFRSAYSIEGLRTIKKHVEDALCLLSKN